MALAGAAVVDHACSAHRQSKGSGPGLVPLCMHPRSWGEGGVRSLPSLPCKVSVGSSPRARGAPGVFSGLSFAVLGCPLLLLPGCVCSVIVGVGVVAAVARGGGGGLDQPLFRNHPPTHLLAYPGAGGSTKAPTQPRPSWAPKSGTNQYGCIISQDWPPKRSSEALSLRTGLHKKKPYPLMAYPNGVGGSILKHPYPLQQPTHPLR